jgi:iron complex transport system substrate-binding protein
MKYLVHLINNVKANRRFLASQCARRTLQNLVLCLTCFTTISFAQYPITIENCGRTLTFDKAPERVLTTYQNVTEILVALGLENKIVAVTDRLTYPPLPQQAEVMENLNYLNTNPNQAGVAREVSLSQEPDFVFSAYFTYDFNTAQGFASVEDFESIGAQVYGISTECAEDASTITIESIYQDILNLGKIFGIETKAQKLVNDMQTRIAAVQEKVASLPPAKTIMFDLYQILEAPLGVYGSGLNADMIRLAGGENVFGQEPQTYLQVSAETIAAQDIDIFTTVDYLRSEAASDNDKKSYLFTNFPNTTASQNERYVSVSAAAFAAGVRIPDSVETLARAYHPQAFKE